jgi:hypothetical protein
MSQRVEPRRRPWGVVAPIGALLACSLLAPSAVHPAPPPRLVAFTLAPAGARLTLDHVETRWFGAIQELPPGLHTVRVEVPSSTCCRPWEGTIRIDAPPPDRPRDVQRVVLSLEVLPAMVTLVDAPCGAEYACATLGLSGGAGSLKTVKLPDVSWSGLCVLVEADGRGPLRRTKVTLQAGAVNAIQWTAP